MIIAIIILALSNVICLVVIKAMINRVKKLKKSNRASTVLLLALYGITFSLTQKKKKK